MVTRPDLAAVLDKHAGCQPNAGLDNTGSGLTGVDVWSCGIRLPYVNDLDSMAQLHLAAALHAALDEWQQQTLRAALHEVWLRIHVSRFDEVQPDSLYHGVTRSEHIVAAYAREHGIDRVYDHVPHLTTDEVVL